MRKLVTFLVMALLVAMFAGGCSLLKREEPPAPPPAGEDRLPGQEQAQTRETVFYFPDAEWQYVVPVYFSIPWEEGIARATVNRLIDGQVPPEILELGFVPLLPAGTEIRGITVRDGLARIDFSRPFLSFPEGRERLMLDGLVWTLTEFSTISRVEVMVEGEKISSLPGGESLAEPLDRKRGINLSVASDVKEFTETDRVTVYFLCTTAKQSFYVPVTRVINPVQDITAAQVTELLRGPSQSSKLFSAIPRGVRLENIDLQGGKITLRLTGELTATGGGQTAADQIRNQFALTLTQLANINEIQVLADGMVPQFPGNADFPATFGRPKTWNKVEKAVSPAPAER